MSARAFLAGFFRDPSTVSGDPGKPSMTRLTLLFLAVETLEVVTTACYVAIKKPDAATIIGALAVVLGTLVTNGIVALRNRAQTGESAS